MGRHSWQGRLLGPLLGRDLAVDLGTANTLVYVRGRGVVLDEPSVVAVDARDGSVVAVGRRAKEMVGRTAGHLLAVRPLKDGVIADFDLTEQMLRYFVHEVHRARYFAAPRMVVCVPSGITSVERRAVRDAADNAGARTVHLIEEPMAAAIGVGLPVTEPTGSMVIDVGGGTTEVAVISYGGVVCSRSVRVAGDELDEAVVTYARKQHSLMLGERTAERVKTEIGSAFPLSDDPGSEVRGRDLVTGLPRTLLLSAGEVRRALDEPVAAIVDAVRATLDTCPPELAGDVMASGMVLTGGGALLKGLDQRLRHETGIAVRTADDPLTSVALGAGRCVEDLDAFRLVLSERT